MAWEYNNICEIEALKQELLIATYLITNSTAFQ